MMGAHIDVNPSLFINAVRSYPPLLGRLYGISVKHSFHLILNHDSKRAFNLFSSVLQRSTERKGIGS
jgi:hypothetical protein